MIKSSNWISFLTVFIFIFSIIVSGNAYASNSFEVNSQPYGAEVYLNDEFIGNTPLQLQNLYPGMYTLKVYSPNHYAFIDNVDIRPGSTTRINRDLKPVNTYGYNTVSYSDICQPSVTRIVNSPCSTRYVHVSDSPYVSYNYYDSYGYNPLLNIIPRILYSKIRRHGHRSHRRQDYNSHVSYNNNRFSGYQKPVHRSGNRTGRSYRSNTTVRNDPARRINYSNSYNNNSVNYKVHSTDTRVNPKRKH